MAGKDYIITNKRAVFVDKHVKLGKNVIIYENCRIEGDSQIDDNVTIYPGCFIVNSIIGKGTKIYSSIIENSKIGGCASVGPYCHLRASIVGDFAHVGDFSVLKHAIVASKDVLAPYSYVAYGKQKEEQKRVVRGAKRSEPKT